MTTTAIPIILEYPSSDDHPSVAGNLKATSEFLPLLNIYYNCWKGTGGCPNDGTANLIQPDLKINGSDGPITLKTSDMMSVTLSLDAKNSSGQNADWWLAAETPFGWHYYKYPDDTWNYVANLDNLLTSYQTGLFNLSPFQLVNTSGLSEGKYTIYFGIDTNMNGLLDFDQLYYDSIVLNITP